MLRLILVVLTIFESYGQQHWVAGNNMGLSAPPLGIYDIVSNVNKPNPGLRSKSSPYLNYNGGPVIQNVNLVPIFANEAVSGQSEMVAFYKSLTKSAVMTTNLKQYGTLNPKQTIGKGTTSQPYVIPGSIPSVLSYYDIVAELTYLFDQQLIPLPLYDTLYAIHFPEGVTIDFFGDGTLVSCIHYCAIHSRFENSYKGFNVYFYAIPYNGGACTNVCGGVYLPYTAPFHEFAEAITDPYLFYGWANGEIENADLCAYNYANLKMDGVTYVVQKLWSNKMNACVDPTKA